MGNQTTFYKPEEDRKPRKNRRLHSTRAQMEERIALAATHLGQLRPPREIVDLLMRVYGVERRMANIYVARAKEKVVEWVGLPALEVRSKIVGGLMAILHLSGTTVKQRLAACDRLILLYGLGYGKGLPRSDQGAEGGVIKLITSEASKPWAERRARAELTDDELAGIAARGRPAG